MARVSILVSVQNESKYIAGCIRSIQDSTYDDWELILVDDGSTDSTVAKIEPFLEDKRINFLALDKSIIGPDYLWANMDALMMSRATGELHAHLGGDDLVMPDRFEQQVAAFDAIPDLDLHHSAAKHINPDCQVLTSVYSARPYHQHNILRMLFAWNTIAFPTVMMKASCFDRIGPFHAHHASCHDYGFWLRSAGRLRYAYSPDFLNYLRVGDNFSFSSEGKIHASQKTYEVRQEQRALLMIEELFPEILRCKDQSLATAAAYLEMGNLWLAGNCPDPMMALKEYQSADKILEDHPLICLNAAIASLALGQNDAAMETLKQLDRSEPLANRALLIAKGVLRGRHQLASGRAICPELWEVAKDLPPATWRSDGTTVGQGAAIHV